MPLKMKPYFLIALVIVIVVHGASFLFVGEHLPLRWIGESIDSAASLSVRGANEFVDVTGGVLWQDFGD